MEIIVTNKPSYNYTEFHVIDENSKTWVGRVWYNSVTKYTGAYNLPGESPDFVRHEIGYYDNREEAINFVHNTLINLYSDVDYEEED